MGIISKIVGVIIVGSLFVALLPPMSVESYFVTFTALYIIFRIILHIFKRHRLNKLIDKRIRRSYQM
ncbi:MAG: hypothetical protein ACTSWY_13820 [Promethearchaeota archaeon]